MKSIRTALLYGLLIWLFAFAVSVVIFPIHDSHRPLFESIMPVALAVATSFFALRYFRKVEGSFVKEGLALGVVITLVNWLIDAAVMLSPSPMQMSLPDYIQDIGVTYFMFLPITLGFGFMAAKAATRSDG